MSDNALKIIGTVVGTIAGIGLVIWLFTIIWPYLLGLVVLLTAWKMITGNNGGGRRSGGEKRSMFQSSARDGLGDRQRDAGDQVPDARDNIAHPYRTGRDRRNGR